MRQLPQAVIEAASILQPTAEVRARATISALAESMPPDAVEKAMVTLGLTEADKRHWRDLVEAAIASFLKHVAEAR